MHATKETHFSTRSEQLCLHLVSWLNASRENPSNRLIRVDSSRQIEVTHARHVGGVLLRQSFGQTSRHGGLLNGKTSPKTPQTSMFFFGRQPLDNTAKPQGKPLRLEGFLELQGHPILCIFCLARISIMQESHGRLPQIHLMEPLGLWLVPTPNLSASLLVAWRLD